MKFGTFQRIYRNFSIKIIIIKLTQLLVMLAKMMAQVGILDNNKRSGGSSPFFGGGAFDFPAWINLNSELLIEWLSCGSFVTRSVHVVSHRSPRDEKRKNGPESPIDDITIGVSTNPTTLPRWNPPIDKPTAVARSLHGNHLKHKYLHNFLASRVIIYLLKYKI